MLVFPLVFAVDEVKVYIHSHLCKHCNCNTRWFWKFSKIHFCFLYQTRGVDPFHNRFVGKEMWGSPTQKTDPKKKSQLEGLDI